MCDEHVQRWMHKNLRIVKLYPMVIEEYLFDYFYSLFFYLEHYHGLLFYLDVSCCTCQESGHPRLDIMNLLCFQSYSMF